MSDLKRIHDLRNLVENHLARARKDPNLSFSVVQWQQYISDYNQLGYHGTEIPDEIAGVKINVSVLQRYAVMINDVPIRKKPHGFWLGMRNRFRNWRDHGKFALGYIDVRHGFVEL